MNSLIRRLGCIALIFAFFLFPGTARLAAKTPSFGAYTNDSPYSGNLYEIDKLAYKLVRNVGIVNWYQSWGGGDWISQVQPSIMKPIVSSGRKALLTWEPFNPEAGTKQPDFRLREIVDGAYDAYITKFANDLEDYDLKIYLRPMHEMNGNWYPWSGTVNKGSPELYIKAWKRIVKKVRAAGADNVKFVWCPYTESYPSKNANKLEAYWPGDKYVDVLALDGYNWGPEYPESGGNRSFGTIFTDPYKRLKKLSEKPIWIAEVGASHDSPTKAKWVTKMWNKASEMSQLKSIVWFDLNKEEDWRAADGPKVTAAFEDFALTENGGAPPAKPDPPLQSQSLTDSQRRQIKRLRASLRPVPGRVAPE